MPYKKKYRKKYRKPQQSFGQSVANAAFQGLKLASRVASLINTEFKYRDVLQTATPLVSNSFLFLTNGISQGTDNTERIGRSVKGKYLYYKWRAEYNPLSPRNVFKMIAIVDKKADGNVPTISELLTAPSELGFRNIDQGERFQILHQKCYTLHQDKPVLCGEEYIDINGKEWAHTEYKGTGPGVADISSYPIYIIIVSGDIANAATVIVNHRYRYIDN